MEKHYVQDLKKPFRFRNTREAILPRMVIRTLGNPASWQEALEFMRNQPCMVEWRNPSQFEFKITLYSPHGGDFLNTPEFLRHIEIIGILH